MNPDQLWTSPAPFLPLLVCAPLSSEDHNSSSDLSIEFMDSIAVVEIVPVGGGGRGFVVGGVIELGIGDDEDVGAEREGRGEEREEDEDDRPAEAAMATAKPNSSSRCYGRNRCR